VGWWEAFPRYRQALGDSYQVSNREIARLLRDGSPIEVN